MECNYYAIKGEWSEGSDVMWLGCGWDVFDNIVDRLLMENVLTKLTEEIFG